MKTPCGGCCSTRISVALTHYTFLTNGDGGANTSMVETAIAASSRPFCFVAHDFKTVLAIFSPPVQSGFPTAGSYAMVTHELGNRHNRSSLLFSQSALHSCVAQAQPGPMQQSHHLDPLHFVNSIQRRALQLVLQNGPASFRITSSHPSRGGPALSRHPLYLRRRRAQRAMT